MRYYSNFFAKQFIHFVNGTQIDTENKSLHTLNQYDATVINYNWRAFIRLATVKIQNAGHWFYSQDGIIGIETALYLVDMLGICQASCKNSLITKIATLAINYFFGWHRTRQLPKRIYAC